MLALGLFTLLLGTEWAVRGAIVVAKRYHLPEFLVGLVVLSIGSDLPEVAVAIDAGLKTLQGTDTSGVVVGSAIGSVVAQIGLVLGIIGLISFLTLPRRYIFQHGAVLLAATALLLLACLDGVVARTEGLTLIVFYIIYLVVLLSRERVDGKLRPAAGTSALRAWLGMAVGLALVVLGSEWTVNSAVALAKQYAVSEAVIAALLIGLGTSLPELSISLNAISKRKVQLSVGNIIGSNVFDTLIPISVAALIAPVTVVSTVVHFDIVFAFFLTLVVLFLFYRRFGLQRPEALLILGLYGVYVAVKLTHIQA
jgi:cation:H+ antiporter